MDLGNEKGTSAWLGLSLIWKELALLACHRIGLMSPGTKERVGWMLTDLFQQIHMFILVLYEQLEWADKRAHPHVR